MDVVVDSQVMAMLQTIPNMEVLGGGRGRGGGGSGGGSDHSTALERQYRQLPLEMAEICLLISAAQCFCSLFALPQRQAAQHVQKR